MKTMTCRQLGGACGLELRGSTADEVIKAQDQHLREAVAAGDSTHEEALEDMKGRWKHPIKGMGWYKNTKRAFAALPEQEQETGPA
jgi:predicted small metal-binding protein